MNRIGCVTRAVWVVMMLAAAGRGDVMQPLGPRDVRVGGEIGRRIEVTIDNNLLALDADRDFLPSFIKRDAGDGYIGLGKLIDSAVRLAAYRGDERTLALKKRLVDFAIEHQEADGYVGRLAPGQRISGLWDVHEIGYIAWGLLTDYELFGEKRSLAAARRAADYVIENWSKTPDDWGRRTGVATDVAVTGLERTMIGLHRVTGEARYLDFVLGPRRLAQWDLPIVIGRRPLIQGHVYHYAARCLAQLELARLTQDAKLISQSRRMVNFMTGADGMMITGATGQWEIWTDDQDGRGELGETCATCYQLRVYEALLRATGDSRFGDLIERTTYNALFAAQSPDGRKLRYFAPTQGPRVYYDGDTYCCPCNYRRGVAEMPQWVYYRGEGGAIVVNLYAESKATIRLGDAAVKIQQATGYPSDGKVSLRVDVEKPLEFPLKLRAPAWVSGMKIEVNGQAIEGPIKPGQFITIARTWKPGDGVTIEMPMPWRLIAGRKRQAGRAAVMRGPLVFCLNPSQHPALAGQDGADLERLVIDPSSMKTVADDSVRPGGIGCRVGLWKSSFSLGGKADYQVTLTEFADPAGRATYFRLRDPAAAVDDALMTEPMFR